MGQDYKIINVNASNFPFLEANILAYGINYHPDSLPANSIKIVENNQVLLPLEFKAPKSTILPTSIVLVLDISASMVGYRFDMLKQTAKEFIKNLPLEISEVAIASFNNQITLNCDFTHNIQLLNRSINNLTTSGGTDFDRAFLTPFTGAINIAQQGQYRKVVIFITDGLSKVKPYEVANKAIYDSTIINCLTIGLPISDELKTIAHETGGNHYSDLNYENEIKNAFEKIYSDVQVNTFGKIKWKAPYSCNPHKTTVISLGHQNFTLKYAIPDGKIGSIDITPSSLNFKAGTPGKTQFKPVFFKGKNIGLNIASITNPNDSLFGYNPTPLPLRSELDEMKMIQFSFTPADSIYAITEYTVKNPGCPDAIIDASSGGVKKLVISSPTAHQEFIRGDAVPIKWSGINKSTSVNFFYQIQENKKWYPIGSGVRYHKNWMAPALTAQIRIQGQVTNHITLANLMTSPNVIIDGSEFEAAYFNSDGTEILTQSAQGIVKNWDAQSGNANHTFEKVQKGDIAFFPSYNRTINISDSTFDVFTNRNGLFMVSLPLGENQLLASFTHIHDKEVYASLTNYSSLKPYIGSSKNGYKTMGTASLNGNFAIVKNKLQLSVHQLQPYKKWFTIKLKEQFKRAILHNNQDYLIIENSNNTQLYNLKNKELISDFSNELFLQYSASNQFILTKDQNFNYINDLKTGLRILKIPIENKYTLSKNGTYIAYSSNDTLNIKSLAHDKEPWTKKYTNPRSLQLFPSSNKLVFLHSDSLSIVNCQTQQTEISVYVQPNLIKLMEVAPHEKTILLTTQNAVAQWNIQTHFDSDTTPFFSIFTPTPQIAKQIIFDKQFINNSTEKVFPRILKNLTPHTLSIDSIYIENSTSNFALVSSAGPIELIPHENKGVEINFTPTTTGKIRANLVVLSGNKKFICAIEGSGINQNYELLTAQFQFPPVLVGLQTDTVLAILKNTGTEKMLIKNLELSTAPENNFVLERNTHPIALNTRDTLWVKVHFNPSNRGRQSTLLKMCINNKSAINATDIMGTGYAKRKVIIAGKTIHSETKDPLKSTLLITELGSQNIILNDETDPFGNYALEINTDLNYSITAQLNGYFSSSENINLLAPQTKDTLWVNIELTPLMQNSMVRLNNVFFEFGKSDLLDISKSEIIRLCKLMNVKPNLKIEIHGHTDNVGNPASNMKLSEARANAVKEFMLEEKVAKNRISIKYFGESEPLKDNISVDGRKANRRVEIKFL